MKNLFGLIIFSFFLALRTFASPCCGGGGSGAQALLLGDEDLILQTQIMQIQDRFLVSDQGYWSDNPSSYLVQSFRVSKLLSDRWQFFASLPLAMSEQNTTYVTDLTLGVGYELLPENSYGLFPPKILIGLSTSILQGPSIYNLPEHEYRYFSKGQSQVGLSMVALKAWQNWDYLLEFQPSLLLPKKQDRSGLSLEQGHAWSSQAQIGYSHKTWRTALGLSWNYEKRFIQNPTNNKSEILESQYYPLSLSLSKPFADNWAASLAVSDSSFVGKPLNTTLQRLYTLTLTYRELR